MSFTTFLLRLVGRSPEQVKEQERFERNLRGLTQSEAELDRLLVEIREVDQVYQEKKDTLEKTKAAISTPPKENDVRIDYTSEHDL